MKKLCIFKLESQLKRNLLTVNSVLDSNGPVEEVEIHIKAASELYKEMCETDGSMNMPALGDVLNEMKNVFHVPFPIVHNFLFQ